MPLACEECDRVADDAHGWIAKVVEDDDELDTHLCVVFLLPHLRRARVRFRLLSPPGR
jgi:hypothetical protein